MDDHRRGVHAARRVVDPADAAATTTVAQTLPLEADLRAIAGGRWTPRLGAVGPCLRASTRAFCLVPASTNLPRPGAAEEAATQAAANHRDTSPIRQPGRPWMGVGVVSSPTLEPEPTEVVDHQGADRVRRLGHRPSFEQPANFVRLMSTVAATTSQERAGS